MRRRGTFKGLRRRNNRVRGARIQCPSCFEQLEIPVDPTAGEEQQFVYDCEICCRPLVVNLTFDGGRLTSASAVRE